VEVTRGCGFGNWKIENGKSERHRSGNSKIEKSGASKLPSRLGASGINEWREKK
jgi:hypothetical protein